MTSGLRSINLTEVEKVNLRRYCWYPVKGDESNIQYSWPYFAKYGDFEYKINNLSNAEIEVARSMLNILSCLELGPSQAAQNIDTDKASVWTHNKTEVSERISLFYQQRLELVHFLGVKAGPEWNSGAIRFIV
ncbi:hypothetical protein [Acetobacter oeni]|uniref:Uncharacterized protein n=1 Tax=Acetobacter oeni TaxID=304077 RepID=A0A511XJ23_9PROT|nr:hypothetical protein [Acetobacter oeni]MBB3882684.1 hypothetical protein [Acetobacter oeni]NHO18787.1 hypothetical protein [Acetobacter oeni]GBR06999.1 hypothetical protein AA21952_2198 [Acetobacter oeni LMG 21952]GEN62939.1 hypothetical protein AOE01nite_11630 [Acetobacter oeni]